MVLQSASLKSLQDFCEEQFKKAAEGENAKLLSADEVKRLTETRNRAEAASKEYDELARNYQQLLKDYNEAILHSATTAEKTKEVEEPAGDAKPANSTFDAEKFTTDWFKKNYPDQI